jgi:putative transposase
MKKKHFTDEQIGYALRQVEAVKTVTETCQEMGISQQTFYRWRRKFAGNGYGRAASPQAT